MPKSYNFLMEELSALEFFGFNKVGSGTIANVMAMVSGCKVLNPLDPPFILEDHCELLWKYYADRGFRTVYFEDSTFNQLGLFPSIRKDLPGVGAHYNLSDFVIGMKHIDTTEMLDSFEDGFGCFDNQFILDTFTEPIVQVGKHFKDKPYLNFVWFAKTGHLVMSNAEYMDDPIHRIMSQMKELRLLENTVVFVVSDHGPWHGTYLTTDAGALERLMPVLYTAFPKSFQEKYAQAFANMKLNTKRLTTQYDLFETLLDLSSLSQLDDNILKERRLTERPLQLGQSLFLPVSLDRTCETANIPPEYCMCWSRSEISNPASTVIVQQAAAFAMIHLNFEIQMFPLCAPLTLQSIEQAKWLGSRVDSPESNELLEVIFTTQPGDGEFLATVSFDPKPRIIGQVTRNNIYKGQSDCISAWKNATYAKTMCLCSTTA